jgi:hypothetical protein
VLDTTGAALAASDGTASSVSRGTGVARKPRTERRVSSASRAEMALATGTLIA